MDFPIQPIPNEIITVILSNLGKNDLLKCRLVSQSWNGLALKILKNPKYGHEHELTQHNIQKFLEFSKERNEEWILPFHINFTRGESERTVEYHQNPNSIQQLQAIFGGKCVVGLTLTHDSGSTLECVQEIISILTLIAPSLGHLDLYEFNIQYDGEEENVKVEEILGNTQLSFPNLSQLKSCPAPLLMEDDEAEQDDENNAIHLFLLKNTPNLKDLEVYSPYAILPIERIGNLRKLKIERELDDLVDLLEPIGICQTPILKDLSLFCSSRLSVLDHQALYDFLSSFSTSLQSLSIKFDEVPTNPFPKLSHLRFLSIQVTHSSPPEARIHVDPEKLNLNSEAFPVLESMDISAHIYFESSDANSKDDWTLRTVKNLSIKVMNSPFNPNAWDMDRNYYVQDPNNPDPPDQYENAIISRPSAKDYVNQLQKIFPNVTSLTLVNETDVHEAYQNNEEYLNELLIEFIQSDGAPRIQKLEIQNCKNNHLGHILNGLDLEREPRVIIENVMLDEEFLNSIKKALQGFSRGSDLRVDKQMEYRNGVENSVITCKAPIIRLKMTSLEKIRMTFLMENEVNRRSRQWGRKPESNQNQKDLFLISLPKHLPLLRQIDISQRMFGDDKEFCKQQIVSVQDTFPDLIITTTH